MVGTAENFWGHLRAAITTLGGPEKAALLLRDTPAQIRYYVAGVMPPREKLRAIDRFANSRLVAEAKLLGVDEANPGGNELKLAGSDTLGDGITSDICSSSMAVKEPDPKTKPAKFSGLDSAWCGVGSDHNWIGEELAHLSAAAAPLQLFDERVWAQWELFLAFIDRYPADKADAKEMDFYGMFELIIRRSMAFAASMAPPLLTPKEVKERLRQLLRTSNNSKKTADQIIDTLLFEIAFMKPTEALRGWLPYQGAIEGALAEFSVTVENAFREKEFGPEETTTILQYFSGALAMDVPPETVIKGLGDCLPEALVLCRELQMALERKKISIDRALPDASKIKAYRAGGSSQASKS